MYSVKESSRKPTLKRHGMPEAWVSLYRLKGWSESLKLGEPVNVGLFDLVAEQHGVDIYTLEPQINVVTKESWLQPEAVHFPREEGAVFGIGRIDPSTWMTVVGSYDEIGVPRRLRR